MIYQHSSRDGPSTIVGGNAECIRHDVSAGESPVVPKLTAQNGLRIVCARLGDTTPRHSAITYITPPITS